MGNPFFNTQKLIQNVSQSAFEQAKQSILTAIQKRNPAVLQNLLKIYQNPHDTLKQMNAANPQAQQQLDGVFAGKSIEEQQKILVLELEKEGINVRAIAAQFGIKL